MGWKPPRTCHVDVLGKKERPTDVGVTLAFDLNLSATEGTYFGLPADDLEAGLASRRASESNVP